MVAILSEWWSVPTTVGTSLIMLQQVSYLYIHKSYPVKYNMLSYFVTIIMIHIASNLSKHFISYKCIHNKMAYLASAKKTFMETYL